MTDPVAEKLRRLSEAAINNPTERNVRAIVDYCRTILFTPAYGKIDRLLAAKFLCDILDGLASTLKEH